MKLGDRFFFAIQAVLKLWPTSIGVKLRSILYRPFFNKFGHNVKIMDGVSIKYPSEISLGDNCYIGEGAFLVGKGGLTIADDFLMGAGSKVITTSHNHGTIAVPFNKQGISFESIKIGNNVWLGFNVIILPGVIIGDNCILSAGCVVTKKFEDSNLILVGVPAYVKSKLNV